MLKGLFVGVLAMSGLVTVVLGVFLLISGVPGVYVFALNPGQALTTRFFPRGPYSLVYGLFLLVYAGWSTMVAFAVARGQPWSQPVLLLFQGLSALGALVLLLFVTGTWSYGLAPILLAVLVTIFALLSA